jgi:hypothetical protein
MKNSAEAEREGTLPCAQAVYLRHADVQHYYFGVFRMLLVA